MRLQYEQEALQFKAMLQNEVSDIRAASQATQAENQRLNNLLSAAVAQLRVRDRYLWRCGFSSLSLISSRFSSQPLQPDAETPGRHNLPHAATRDAQTPTKDPRVRTTAGASRTSSAAQQPAPPPPTPAQTRKNPPRSSATNSPKPTATPPPSRSRSSPKPPPPSNSSSNPPRPSSGASSTPQKKATKKRASTKPAEHQMLLSETSPEARTLKVLIYLILPPSNQHQYRHSDHLLLSPPLHLGLLGLYSRSCFGRTGGC